MRRSTVLVTDMSGTGKSTILQALGRSGHQVVDTDESGWIIDSHTAYSPDRPEPRWDLARVGALLEAHLQGWLFIAGCVANQGVMYDRFDAVVLLTAPVDVLLTRVSDRANPFGSQPADRAKIATDLAEFEPVLRAGADQEISTTASVAEVVAAIERIAGNADRRRRS